MRLDGLLSGSVADHPDRGAVEDANGVRLTYGEFDQRSAAVAEQLGAAGVGDGNRVGICAPKCLATVVAIFGALRAGCCLRQKPAYILSDAPGNDEPS